MLTRLKVKGFKNLVDIDVYFGPFTCIAGPNGVGKSNLFDSIRFLSALADLPLVDAASSIRADRGRPSDLRSLFHRFGEQIDPVMQFEAEMLVPPQVVDDLGQTANASATFLRYSLKLVFRESTHLGSGGTLEIADESLSHIRKKEAAKRLLFPHKVRDWRESAVDAIHRSAPFISTKESEDDRFILVHQDGGSRGRPLRRPASQLPRTVLSVSNAAESPTATVARSEMRSWKLLQLEPTALRRPDDFGSPHELELNGEHLPSALYHLARRSPNGAPAGEERLQQVYCSVANRLAELIDDVGEVWVDPDEKREILTLIARDRSGTSYPARALSDGTLRFLALAVLEADTQVQGLICLEEPENGIHPKRIPAMLELLEDIAVDPEEPIDSGNPLRQVIINTHSPVVVNEIADQNLLVAELDEQIRDGRRFKKLQLRCLSDTWRAKTTRTPTTTKGSLLAYLNPYMRIGDLPRGGKTTRVADRQELGELFRVS